MTDLRTARTALRRRSPRGSHDRAVIDPILDEGLLCHVGWTDAHGPAVIPTTYARSGDDLLMHGALAARWLQPGLPLCVVVTLLDGLVLARSAMHHSANYRAVVLYGVGELVVDRAAKLRALEAIVEHIVPGRRTDTRGPSSKELAATAVLRLPITEASAKVRTGGPIDDEEDLSLPHWAGVLPIAMRVGAPIAACDESIALPDHVRSWKRETPPR
jgi:nitroimidazol reductase NimA-like FMN-containing flavoprotein (pyridoxamine 5'-phosphate oxidase superfamily)